MPYLNSTLFWIVTYVGSCLPMFWDSPTVKGQAVQEEYWEQADVQLYRGWCPMQDDVGLTT
jgi:predicted DNA-binding WGR domain protein